MVSEVRHVFLVFVVRVVTFSSHRIVVVTMETAMMVRAIVEVLRIIVSIVVTVFHLVMGVMDVRVVVHSDVFRFMKMMHINREIMVDLIMSLEFVLVGPIFVMNSIQAFNVVVVMTMMLNDMGYLVVNNRDNLVVD